MLENRKQWGFAQFITIAAICMRGVLSSVVLEVDAFKSHTASQKCLGLHPENSCSWKSVDTK